MFVTFRKPLLFVFILLFSLRSGVFAEDEVIKLGIQKDFLAENSLIQSYSSWVRFNDDTANKDGLYPPQYMSGSQLVRLAIIAYNEMLEIFDGLPLESKDRPSAMIAFALGQNIYFASSMKGQFREFYKGGPGLVHPTLLQGLQNCQRIGEKSHRKGLACGEPNVLDLCLNAITDADISENGRMTAWLTYDGVIGHEENRSPCLKDTAGYGCAQILLEFDIDVVAKVVPDDKDGNGNEWYGSFVIGQNPRKVCKS